MARREDLNTPTASSRASRVAARNRFAEACVYGVAVVGKQEQRLCRIWLAPMPLR